MIRIDVLGVIELGDGHIRGPLNGPRQRQLLCALLARRANVVPAGELVRELWPDRLSGSVQNALYAQISRLRATLEAYGGAEVRLRAHSPGYLLDVPARCIDAERFRAACAAAEELWHGDPEAVANGYRAALDIWRGPALQDVPAGPIRDAEAARLGRERMLATARLAEAELSLERHSAVIQLLEPLSLDDPLDERVCQLLMRAFAGAGRAREALDVYQRTRRSFIAELGIGPSPALEAVLRRVLSVEDPAAPVGD